VVWLPDSAAASECPAAALHRFNRLMDQRFNDFSNFRVTSRQIWDSTRMNGQNAKRKN
jgi:hypothetical protein